MKANLQIILLLSSMVSSLTALIFVFNTSTKYLALNAEIKSTIQQKEDFLLSAKKEKETLISKLAFETRRNEELVSDLETKQINFDEVQKEISNLQSQIENFNDQIKENELIIFNANEAKQEFIDLKTEATNKTSQLSQQIPTLENQLLVLKNEEEDALLQIARVKKKLSDHQSFSEMLRQHFSNSLKAIRQYSRERAWIESGDLLAAVPHTVDLSSGTVALTIGADNGIKDGMMFSVVSNEKEIGRLRIKEVFAKRAVGMLIPLFGNPSKLERISKIDLINL